MAVHTLGGPRVALAKSAHLSLGPGLGSIAAFNHPPTVLSGEVDGMTGLTKIRGRRETAVRGSVRTIVLLRLPKTGTDRIGGVRLPPGGGLGGSRKGQHEDR